MPVKRVLKMDGYYYFRPTPLPGIDYSINPYFGCEFKCVYCYSQMYFKLRAIKHEWGNYVEAKVYLPRILSRNLHKFKNNAIIGIGTYSDPYQPWESELKLTRRIIEILLRRDDLKLSIETKSPLILRDLDVLKKGDVEIGFSITSLEEDYIKFFESHAPHPKARFKALKEMVRNGIDTWVFIAPIMPNLNDDKSNLEEVIKKAYEIGIKKIYSDVLRLRLGVRESIIKVLKKYNPSLVPYYRDLNRPEIYRKYSQTVNFLEKKCEEYNIKYVDIAKMMWDYLK